MTEELIYPQEIVFLRVHNLLSRKNSLALQTSLERTQI